jgi:hypothetical protein
MRGVMNEEKMMKPTTEHSEEHELELPQGHAIAYVDTQEQVDKIVEILKQAGFEEDRLLVLHGEEGIELVHQEDRKFYFGDGEDSLLDHALQELEDGNYLLGIEVADRDEALRVLQLAEPAGARRFSYFGTWINERMTK